MAKTKKTLVTNHEDGMREALAQTEKLGENSGLETKEILRLRLLGEELFGMLRSVTGNISAEYWVEQVGRKFDLHLRADVKLTGEMREQLISASSKGENAAAKGFMGKIRVMIGEKLFGNTSDSSLFSELSLGMTSTAGNSDPYAQQAAAEAFLWSMKTYKEAVSSEKKENTAARDAWDELEKSIVANLADDVRVWIVGSSVEITVSKSF